MSNSTTGPRILRLTNHGGRCCGVKHLHEFPYAPNHSVVAYKSGKKDGGNGYTQMNQPGKAFRYVKYPAQTGLERLKAVLAECKLKQPKGLVEVILPLNVADLWQEHLLELGFEKGPEFVNSNTYSKLQVYYLVNK